MNPFAFPLLFLLVLLGSPVAASLAATPAGSAGVTRWTEGGTASYLSVAADEDDDEEDDDEEDDEG